MLFEVYKCVQLNICSVVMFCRGGRGNWTDVGELGSEWAVESEGWIGELVSVGD